MTPRRLSIAAVTLAVVVLLAIGLLQAGSSPSTAPSTLSLTQMRAQLAGSPEPFASLHAQAGALLPGGPPARRAGPACAPGGAARSAAGYQQVGVLVRTVPLGVRRLPAGRAGAGAAGRIPRDRLGRHRRGRPRRSARQSRSVTPL